MNILDARFKYVPSGNTKIEETFDRLFPGWRPEPRPKIVAAREVSDATNIGIDHEENAHV